MSNMNKLCLLIGEDIHIVLVGFLLLIVLLRILPRGRRCRDRMVVGFTTTYAISAYRYCEFESRSWRSVQHYVIKFVSDFRQVGGFLLVLRFPPPIKRTSTI